MPTYTCTVPAGGLEPDRVAKLAVAITLAHGEITGAASGFAQVIVHEVPPTAVYLGGRPLSGEHLFVRGEIRAGRSSRDRDRLIARLVEDCAAAADLPRHAVWVYLAELPARCMAEYGHVLPEPGEEEPWLAALPEADRARLTGSDREAQ